MVEKKFAVHILTCKLTGCAAGITAAVWMCAYLFQRLPVSVTTETEGFGIFAVVLAGGIAVAVALILVLIAACAALVLLLCGLIFSCLEKRGAVNAPEKKKGALVFRILSDSFLVLGAVLVLLFSVGTKNMPWLALSVVLSGMTVLSVVYTEVRRAIRARKINEKEQL